MDKNLVDHESRVSPPDPKIFGLPRPLAGAAVGILVFALFLSLARFTESKYLLSVLIFPYFIIALFFSSSISGLSGVGNMVLLFIVSSIAPAMIGSMIASKDKTRRTNGITVLGIYVFISLIAGFLVLVAASLFN